MNTLLNIACGFIGIGLVIFIHEAGHLVAAQLSHITVEVFSFGMGPKIFSWPWKGIEFRLSMIPLGGYCKLKGADDLTRALEAKAPAFVHTESGSLFGASPFHRFIMYLAGPLSNIIFAVLMYALFFSISYNTVSDPARIVVTSDYPQLLGIEQNDNAAFLAGLQTGDIVTAINGNPIRDYQMMLEVLSEETVLSPTQFTVLRNGQEKTVSVNPAGVTPDKAPRYGISSFLEPVVDVVQPNSPEQQAGLQSGDRIISAGQSAVTNMLDILSALQAPEGTPQSYTIERKQEGITTTHHISFFPLHDDQGKPQLSFSLVSGSRPVKGANIVESLGKAVQHTGMMMVTTVQSLFNLLIGQASLRDTFTGPWRASMLIGNITTHGFREGFSSGLRALLYLLGIVSVSLAIANLLPVPALDGGFMLICLLEAIRRKQFAPRTYMCIQIIGMICIIAIIGIMSLADLRYYLG